MGLHNDFLLWSFAGADNRGYCSSICIKIMASQWKGPSLLLQLRLRDEQQTVEPDLTPYHWSEENRLKNNNPCSIFWLKTAVRQKKTKKTKNTQRAWVFVFCPSTSDLNVLVFQDSGWTLNYEYLYPRMLAHHGHCFPLVGSAATGEIHHLQGHTHEQGRLLW